MARSAKTRHTGAPSPPKEANPIMTSRCPRCHTALDEGPVIYRCAHCRRTVYAADLDTEYHALLATTGAGP